MDEFFGIVFKSIKVDKNVERALAFIKRLLQMCYVNETGYIAATMLVVSEVLKTRSDIRFQLYQSMVFKSAKKEDGLNARN